MGDHCAGDIRLLAEDPVDAPGQIQPVLKLHTVAAHVDKLLGLHAGDFLRFGDSLQHLLYGQQRATGVAVLGKVQAVGALARDGAARADDVYHGLLGRAHYCLL